MGPRTSGDILSCGGRMLLPSWRMSVADGLYPHFLRVFVSAPPPRTLQASLLFHPDLQEFLPRRMSMRHAQTQNWRCCLWKTWCPRFLLSMADFQAYVCLVTHRASGCPGWGTGCMQRPARTPARAHWHSRQRCFLMSASRHADLHQTGPLSGIAHARQSTGCPMIAHSFVRP